MAYILHVHVCVHTRAYNIHVYCSNLSSAIFQYDIESPSTNRRISPAPQLPASSQTTPTTPQPGPLSCESCDYMNWLHNSLSLSVSLSLSLSLSLARSKKQEFIEKLRDLQRKLEQGGYGDPDEAQNASFGRETLLADAYQFVMGSSAKDLRRRRLNARWDREEGWGREGGREWRRREIAICVKACTDCRGRFC